MRLSVAIITKNEQDVIARCLASLSQADEIVVVDTGSTDHTKAIARLFTPHVSDFAWCDDFAAARNAAIERCTGDWVLILDADEWVDDLQPLKDALGTECDALLGAVAYNGKKSHAHVRVIRPHLRYIYPIHEVVTGATNIGTSPLVINHAQGYAHRLDPDRNLRILERVMQDAPLPRHQYYLAREYVYRQRWDDAIAALEAYVKVSTFKAERADAYLMLAEAKWKSNRADAAREDCLRAIMLNPNCKAALLQMATMSFEAQAVVWRKFAEVATNEDVLFVR